MRRPVVWMLAWVWLSVGLLPAQVREAWVARYDGPAHDSDDAHAIAVDAEGNVYVTGSSYGLRSSDATTIKYDPQGQPVWVARYEGPGCCRSAGFAIGLDGKGGVYVTGQSLGYRQSFDYLTIKYDSEGNEVWVDRYYESWYSNGQARTLAVDVEGNVYVTGWRQDLSLGIDSGYVTIKYDTEGHQVWVARYDGPGHGPDGPAAIALDAEGNVYVAGGSKGSDGRFDYATIKYDRGGREVWVARFNEPGNGNASAKALALDTEGNVYVTGLSVGEGPYTHYATIKYDSEGHEVWMARYDGPDSGGSAQALVVDSKGHVYVTGNNAGVGTDLDYATIKYDTDGQEVWVARYDGPAHGLDWPSAITVDGNDNVYVTGWSEVDRTRYDYDYITVKYNPQGQEVWVARYDGPRHEQDYAAAIAVDKDANVYVTGASCGLIGFGCSDYATIKYSQK